MSVPRLQGERVVLEPMGPDDVSLRVRLETDDSVMSHLGGARRQDQVEKAHAESLVMAERGECWPLKVMVDGEAAGSVVIFRSSPLGAPLFEMGWVIDPRFQGRGVASEAAQVMVDGARREHTFGDELHAFPPVSNAASNRVCEKLGCELLGPHDFDFGGRQLRCNHWRLRLR